MRDRQYITLQQDRAEWIVLLTTQDITYRLKNENKAKRNTDTQ